MSWCLSALEVCKSENNLGEIVEYWCLFLPDSYVKY